MREWCFCFVWVFGRTEASSLTDVVAQGLDHHAVALDGREEAAEPFLSEWAVVVEELVTCINQSIRNFHPQKAHMTYT